MNKEQIDHWVDPVVKEVREARDAFAKQFNYDVNAIFDYLKKMEEEGRAEGRVYVDRPTKT